MERKLASMLAHQFHLQDTEQQRPFPETPLGKLPGEIREMIYEHLLVAPPPQQMRYLRVPLMAATNSDIMPAKGANVTADSKAASADPPQLAPAPYSRFAKVSCLAILQTCHQINREAYHIFYAKNSFHFTNVPDLLAFLIGIGKGRRAELTSLHLEGLVVDQPFWIKEVLDSYCLEHNIGSVEREEREAEHCLALHADICQVSELLDDCKNLSRLHFEMRTCERLHYFLFLIFDLGRGRSVVYLVDGSRWVVRWPYTEENEGALWKKGYKGIAWHDEIVEKWEAYTACYPIQDLDGIFSVMVDIIRGPEEGLEGGHQSWVAVS
ncbi:MAG: hypothetical protein ASARMPREDX12_009423 [Alectoria sarmentosa]|nr:MAG: hypothetical protein ASARMPREDX12_009423 [Alectoria sarmentosa]